MLLYLFHVLHVTSMLVTQMCLQCRLRRLLTRLLTIRRK